MGQICLIFAARGVFAEGPKPAPSLGRRRVALDSHYRVWQDCRSILVGGPMRSFLLGAAVVISIAAAQAGISMYKTVALDDLKVGKAQMLGRPISVHSTVQVMGEIAVMKSGPTDMTPVLVDISRLPPDTRKRLLTDCAGGCSMWLNGRVGSVMTQPGLIADTGYFN
jgi:hypothetical protein